MTTDLIPLHATGAAALGLANVFLENASWLLSVVRRLGVSERHASDVVHDLFLDLHRNLIRYDPSRPLRPWLYGFAVRAAQAHRRRAHVRCEKLAAEPPADIVDSPESTLQSTQRRNFVHLLLEHLDDKQRAVLVLVDLEETAVSDVAVVLDLPLNTAYSRLRLARQAFAELATRALLRGEVP